jgi:polyferredoxin
MADSSGGGHGGVTTAAWLVVAVVIAGSIVSAVALIEWIWPVFWVGVGLMVVGSIGGLATGMMDMVTEYSIVSRPELEQH